MTDIVHSLPVVPDKTSNNLQQEIAAEAAFATEVSSLISSAVRREYLDNGLYYQVIKHDSNGVNTNDIYWLKITEIGISDEKSPVVNIHTIMEQTLQALHFPGKCRILFEVSSDAEIIVVKLGIQSLFNSNASLLQSVEKTPQLAEYICNYVKQNYSGVKCELISPFADTSDSTIKSFKDGSRCAIRCITGLPAFRDKNEHTSFSSIDRLANALHGYKWSYLVIATPVFNSEISDIANICRDISGRMESMKSMQIGKSLSEATSETSGSSEYGIPFSGIIREALSLISNNFITDQQTKEAVEKIKNVTLAKSSNSAFSITNGTSISKNIVNKHAEHIANLLDEQTHRFELTATLGGWDVGAYFIAQDDTIADTGVSILKSQASGDKSWYEPIRVHTMQIGANATFRNDLLGVLSNYENPNVKVATPEGGVLIHPFDNGNRKNLYFSRNRTLLNSRELSQLINFPTQSMPGVIAHRVLSDTGLSVQSPEGKINFGKQIYRGSIMEKFPYYINPDSFSKHSLVCGISRSGKTNTIIGVLNEMQKKQIPFMVIEPAKQEYVEWAIQQNKKLEEELGSSEKAQADPRWINIYIPGRESFRGTDLEKLYLNPFDFVWLNEEEEPKTAEHIDRLKTVINAALPMYEILPVLMEELIYSAYSVKHARLSENDKYPSWLPNTSQERYPHFEEKIYIPSFQELRMLIPKIFEKRAYAQDVSRNLRAALETRIDSFKRGWRKELLNRDNPRKTRADWEKLFARPSVVNLTSLTSDEDKAFFMSVLLLFIYEFNQEKYELNQLPGNGKLNHLLIIEEAHRVLEKCEGAGISSAAPKQKVSEMFSNMISEVGAYGQGIMIADQVPSRLNNDAIKNTNLKIVHKLVSADDRNAMATALNLQDDQERIIGELSVGEVLLRTDMDKDVYMVKVNKNK